MLAPGSALAATQKFEGPLLGCTYKVTIEAEEEATSGTYEASLSGCTAEVSFELKGSFDEESVTLGEVQATATIAGHEIPIEENLDIRISVPGELARAIKSAKETVQEVKKHREEAEAAAKQIEKAAEKQLIETASEKLLSQATGLVFKEDLRGLQEHEQSYCEEFEIEEQAEPPRVCIPNICPERCAQKNRS
jgi:hypothetical protein